MYQYPLKALLFFFCSDVDYGTPEAPFWNMGTMLSKQCCVRFCNAAVLIRNGKNNT